MRNLTRQVSIIVPVIGVLSSYPTERASSSFVNSEDWRSQLAGEYRRRGIISGVSGDFLYDDQSDCSASAKRDSYCDASRREVFAISRHVRVFHYSLLTHF